MAKISKKQQAAIEAQQQREAMQMEAQDFIAGVHQLDEWVKGTPDHRTALLDSYIEKQWNEYAKGRWGDDLITADAYRSTWEQPLREEIRRQQKDVESWGNRLGALGDSLMSGVDTTIDMGYALPATIDSMQDQHYRQRVADLQAKLRDISLSPGSYISPEAQQEDYYNTQVELEEALAALKANEPELSESMQILSQELAKSAANKAQRRKDNPTTDYLARRREEINMMNPDDGALNFWRQVGENPAMIGHLLVEQVSNMVPQIGASLAGGAVGTAVAGPAGMVIGGTTASSLVGALQGAAEVASGIAQEIFSADPNILITMPEYQELAKQGFTDKEIRTQMVAKAITEAAPRAAALTGATSIFGPETMLAKTSIVQGLMKKGIIQRSAVAAAVGAPSEAVEEGGQQVLQNIGWNTATGDQRNLMEGAAEAASQGLLVGGVMSGTAGAFSSPEKKSPTGGSTGTNTPPPTRGQGGSSSAGTAPAGASSGNTPPTPITSHSVAKINGVTTSMIDGQEYSPQLFVELEEVKKAKGNSKKTAAEIADLYNQSNPHGIQVDEATVEQYLGLDSPRRKRLRADAKKHGGT